MKQSIAAAILVTLLIGVVATAVVLTQVPSECDWQPFPPDRYDALSLCKAGPGFFEQLGIIVLGIVWPFQVTQLAEIFFKKPLDIRTSTHYINNITTATKELS